MKAGHTKLTGLAGVGALLLSQALAVRAADIFVSDEVNINGGDGKCALIEAIVNAEDDMATFPDCVGGNGTDRILLMPGLTIYELTQNYIATDNGLPVITGDLVISGSGATIRRAPGAPDLRLMEISGSTVSLSNLTLQDGHSTGVSLGGGGLLIRNGATVQMDNVSFLNNRASGLFTFGGGLRIDSSTVTINDSTFVGNEATSTGNEHGGGAIAQYDGFLQVNRSSFLDNFTDIQCSPMTPDNIAATGGALRIEGVGSGGARADFSDTTFTGNIGRVGGAIHVAAIADTGAPAQDVLVQLFRSTIVLNDATGCPGAGLGDGVYVQEAFGGMGVVVFGGSILHGNGHPIGGDILGTDCQSNFPSQDFFSNEGNVIDDDDNCPTFGFDALVGNVADVLNLTLNGDHFLPLRDGAAVDNPAAGNGCPLGSQDQQGKLRRNGPGQGGDACDSGAIELYYPIEDRTLTVSLTGAGFGSVSSMPPGIDCPGTCSADFAQDEMLELIPQANPGSQFVDWSGDCTGAGSCLPDMSTDRMVSARFEPIMYTLDVSLQGTGSGAVISSPVGINCPGSCSASFLTGTAVSLSVAPDSGSALQNFAGACSGQICNLDLTQDLQVIAVLQDSEGVFLDSLE